MCDDALNLPATAPEGAGQRRGTRAVSELGADCCVAQRALPGRHLRDRREASAEFEPEMFLDDRRRCRRKPESHRQINGTRNDVRIRWMCTRSCRSRPMVLALGR